MTHLTQSERYHIQAGIGVGRSQKEIAAELGKHPSTISRECRRNVCADGFYRADVAHEQSCVRRHRASCGKRYDDAAMKAVLKKVRQDGWSPASAVNRLYLERGIWISHQTVYNRLHEEGHSRPRYIKRYRKRGTLEQRGRIPRRTGIAERPAIANRRGRRGDWEADTMLGKRGNGRAIAVVCDRKTRHTSLRLMERRTAKEMNRCIRRIVSCSPTRPFTITFDNGMEFSLHKLLRLLTGLRCFFTDTYAAWQKGTVENIIGVLRRWLPKDADLSALTPQRLAKVQRWFNNRPMKALGYRTPYEAYNLTQTIAFHF